MHPTAPAAVRGPVPLALPAVYHDDTVVRAFAMAIGEALAPAEELLDGLDALLDPWRAPPAFLDWLVRITGARVEPGWTADQRRKAIDLAPRLAAHRGTPYGLRLEAKEIHGWDLDIGDPGGVRTTDDPPAPAGRMLTVTLTAGAGRTSGRSNAGSPASSGHTARPICPSASRSSATPDERSQQG